MIRIESEPWAEMVAHARETYPNECCGAMLGSTDGEQKAVRVAIRLRNAFEGSQAARYELRPADLMAAEKAARERHMDLIGIYHSHPDCSFHIDHNHACCPGKRCCGKCIRGLLCQSCNDLIGKAREKADTLHRCAGYVQGWDRAYTLTVEALRRAPYLEALQKKLLLLGGKAVVLWGGNNGPQTVSNLLANGKLDSVEGLVIQAMVPQNCHENVTQLGGEYVIRTGYALSAESIWYPHSWALNVIGCVVETTLPARAYFGCSPDLMTDDWRQQKHFILTKDWESIK